MRWRSMAPLFVVAVAAVGGCQGKSEMYSVEPTSKCLSATGVRVIYWLPNEEAGDDEDPFPTSGGSLLAKGAYDVNVRFGKDAGEAEAVADKLEHQVFLDRFEGREYRFVVRRRSNAVVSARVPTDEEPDEQSLRDVLEAADGCLRAA